MLNSRPVISLLLKKYHKEKWVLSPKEVLVIHERMGVQYKKFHTPGVEEKLHHPTNNLWFGLKSGVFFDRHEFLLVGDSLDELRVNYQLKAELKTQFLKFEGYTMYYKNGENTKKMTLSGPEVKFFQQYIKICDDWLNPTPWDDEEITDMDF